MGSFFSYFLFGASFVQTGESVPLGARMWLKLDLQSTSSSIPSPHFAFFSLVSPIPTPGEEMSYILNSGLRFFNGAWERRGHER